jgi:hypothetical protein
MEMNRKRLGWSLAIGAACIIFYCVTANSYNEKQVADNFTVTVLSDGANLRAHAYTFLPPYSMFELGVLAAGVVGVILLLKKEPERSGSAIQGIKRGVSQGVEDAFERLRSGR